MYPKTLLRPWIAALALLLTLLSAPAPAGAQTDVPLDSNDGWRIARPRGAVLSVFDGAAETFLFDQGRDADTPLDLGADNAEAGVALWADYEALFLPLSAGFGRFELSAARVRGDALELLDEDHVDVVAFGASRRSGRLSLRVKLEPGLHQLEIASVARMRPVGVAQWTIDSDRRRVWVFVAGGDATPLSGAAAAAPRADLAQDTTRVAPVGGLHVGAQRGVADPQALGALNLAAGHDARLRTSVGQDVHVWSDHELWWSEQAVAAGSSVLAVFPAPTNSVAQPAPLGSDAHAVREGSGPRLDDGFLHVRLRFDQPGTYRLVARLTTSMSRGSDAAGAAGETVSDSDLVPFSVEVLPAPARSGSIAGGVFGRTDAPAVDPDLAPDLTAAMPLEGVRVEALDAQGHLAGVATSNAQGRYRIDDLAPGVYRVAAKPAPQNYLDQWWPRSRSPRGGELLDVAAGETTDGIRFLLVPGATITGKVGDTAGRPLSGIEITVGPWPSAQPAAPEPGRPLDARPRQDQPAPDDGSANAVWRTRTNEEGFYAVDRLPAGAFWVRARDPQGRLRTEYYENAATLADAQPVKTEAGAVVEGIDFALGEGGVIRGTVVEQSDRTVRLPLGGMTIEARSAEDPERTVAATSSNDDGTYRLGPLPEGRYLVRASDPAGNYHAEWFREAETAAEAEPVPLREGSQHEDVAFTLEPRQRQTRILVDPRQTVVPQGAEGRFSVAVGEVTNLGAFEIVLEWQPEVFAVEELVLGDFLGSTGREVIPVEPEIDNERGRLVFAAASLGRPGGPSGEGPLFWVRFIAKEMGETRVEIAESVLTDPAAEDIAHVRAGGSLEVGGCLYADFNCDCRVDIRDVMEVVVRWGMVEGDPDWEPRFDLRPDGRIDIVDVQIVAGEWGTRCVREPEPGPEPDRPVPAGEAAIREPAGAFDELRRSSLAAMPQLELEQRRDLPFALDGGAAGLRLSAEPVAPRVGETVRVRVEAVEAVALAGFELRLAYDAARLSPLGAEVGAFLGSGGRSVTSLGPALAADGVTLAAFSLPGADAASGDGELAIFSFRVLAEGAAAVSLEEATLVDTLGESGAVAAEAVTVNALPAEATAARAFIPMAARR